MSIMKAVRVFEFGGPEMMKIVKDVPIPKPNAKQVLIQVKCAGVNPVDTYIRSGTYKAKPQLPYTPGSDGAGIVHDVSEETKSIRKGDMVYFRNSLTGSYAEYTLVDESNVFALNSKLSFSAGAAMGVPYFTAYRALVQKCRPKPGQSVLVHGASGAVGIATCQMARQLGLFVLGTAGSEQGKKLVESNGAHQAIDHSVSGHANHILEATNNKGVDNIIEMLANVNLETDMQVATPGGKIAIVGNRGTIEITPRHAMANELTIHGVMMGHATKSDIAEAAAFFKQGMESGWLVPHVGQSFSMEAVAEAHKQIIAQSGGAHGKIVLNIE